MAIRIVTDSSSDFDPAVAKRRNVEIVSMPIQFGKATFLDGKTISSEVFYKLLRRVRRTLPPPSPPLTIFSRSLRPPRPPETR